MDLTEVRWRKSSRSGPTGGNCVEVARVPASWRKSSRSEPNGGNCVEVAREAGPARIAARDSKRPDGPHLRFAVGDWRRFLTEVKSGRFDHDRGSQ
jgi:hypothetical protein